MNTTNLIAINAITKTLDLTHTQPHSCPKTIQKIYHIIRTIGDKPSMTRLHANSALLRSFQNIAQSERIPISKVTSIHNLWKIIISSYNELKNREDWTCKRIDNALQENKK